MLSFKLHHFTLYVKPGATHRNRQPIATVNMNFLIASPHSKKHLQKPRHYIFLPISCFLLHPSNFVKCSHAMYKSFSSHSECVMIIACTEEVKFHTNVIASLDNVWYKIRDASHHDITHLCPPPLCKVLITAQEFKYRIFR